MKYLDGLNYLDQLKDFVETSLTRHQTSHVKIEQNDEIEFDKNTEAVNDKDQLEYTLTIDKVVGSVDDCISIDENVIPIKEGKKFTNFRYFFCTSFRNYFSHQL